MNSRQTFRPRATEKLSENGFGLIIEGVGSGDGIERDLLLQLAKPRVA